MTSAATAVWRCGPTATYTNASNTNSGGFDASIASAGTDYSNPANTPSSLGGPIIATFNDLTGSGTGPFTTAAAVTTAMIGNAIYITGGGATAGWYFINAVVANTSISLTATPGTLTNASGTIGGMWADFYTNTLGSNFPIVAGNIVYLRGTGSGSKASPDFTVNNSTNSNSGFGGNVTTGWIKFVGETGRVYIKDTNGQLFHTASNPTPSGLWGENLYYYQTSASARGCSFAIAVNCIFDQNGLDSAPSNSVGLVEARFCESFSSVTPSATAVVAVGFGFSTAGSGICIGCNAHDLAGDGYFFSGLNIGFIQYCVAHNCSGNNVNAVGNTSFVADRCVSDSPTGHGFLMQGINAVYSSITGCLVTNVPATKYAIDYDTVTFSLMEDGNTFYNPLAAGNVHGLAIPGPNDKVLGASPYVNAGQQNWGVSASLEGTGYPLTWPQSLAGKTTITNYVAPGAVAP